MLEKRPSAHNLKGRGGRFFARPSKQKRSGSAPMHDHHDENGHRLTRRTLLKAAAAFGAGAAIPSGAWAFSPPVAAEMGKAAAAWLASLDAGQRARAQFPWTDSHRDDWHY